MVRLAIGCMFSNVLFCMCIDWVRAVVLVEMMGLLAIFGMMMGLFVVGM